MKTTASRTATADGLRRRRRPDVGLRRPLPVMPGSIFDRFSKNLVEQNEVILDAFNCFCLFFTFFVQILKSRNLIPLQFAASVFTSSSSSLCQAEILTRSRRRRRWRRRWRRWRLRWRRRRWSRSKRTSPQASGQGTNLRFFFSLFSYSLVFWR